MNIKSVKAKTILDTRGDKTICVELITDFGKFYASAPNGKSTGKYEAKSYNGTIVGDINKINSIKITNIQIESFNDLKNLEKIFLDKVGANTMIALEYAFLKALSYKQKKQVWQLINPKAKKLPMPVGNAIGGGAHSHPSNNKKPDFQEFLFIPETNFKKAVEINKRARENCAEILKNIDKKFRKEKNDENAWQTSLNNEQIMNVVMDVKENMIDEFGVKIHCGIDLASSQFFRLADKKYYYKNNIKVLDKEKQINYASEIADKFYYLEDPLDEIDFNGFKELNKKSRGLIVGDDLTVTNLDRIAKAVKEKSINAVIIKPNQNGSLIAVKDIIEFCKKNKIKTIFSHRSGETSEDILADLAFGFQADFIKTGISGRGRDEKLNRLIEIEKFVNNNFI